MRGHTCSGGWRVAALLLGASWLVTLAVACGGGDDAVAPAPSAAHAAGGSTRAEAGAGVGAGTLAPQALALVLAPALAPAHHAAAMPAAPLQPCADAPRQALRVAAVPAHLRPPVVQDHGLSDEALKSPLGDQGASAAGVQLADPFDTQ